ncbi:MAG: DUF4252 domain-containing protein [Ginsengibacter sp.]
MTNLMNPVINRLKFLLIFLLLAITFSSCFISSRSNIDVFNKSEYASSVSVKTIKVPMFITKPIVKNYLRQEEDVPKEITDLISSFKKVRVTLAQTTNPKLVSDFRTAVKSYAGQEWLSVHNGNQWIYLKVDQNGNDVIKRITVAISAPDENQLVYVNLKCNLTPDQLSKLINLAMDSDEGKKVLKEGVKG